MQTLISYSQELREKKTAARIFWLVVFLFAGFLYFFFQGYYPNIEFRLANIGSGILSGEERGVTIRSFGIVNVKASPPDSLLTLNSSSYGNNEKRMIDYGEYTMTISRDNYLSGAIHFSINKEKPFYIDTLTLIPKPGYVPYPRKIENIAKIDTDSWTAQSASGMILFENGFATGTLISRGNMTHIGEGRFLSGNMIVSYDLSTQTWVNEENKAWESFLKRCGTVIVENKILFCPKTQEGISSEENIFTGILNIRNDYIKTTAGIITYGNGGPKKIISFSGVTVKDDTQFILVENHWYLVQMGLLVSVTGEKKRIITPLESIQHIEWVNNNLLIFGKKGKDTFLSFLDTNNPEQTRTIPFPDIPLTELRIWETGGNLFIKTLGALLLIYHGSDEIKWIVEGEILAVGDDFAIYRKDERLWEANWKEEVQ